MCQSNPYSFDIDFELIKVSFCLKYYMSFIKSAFSKYLIVYLEIWTVLLFTTSELNNKLQIKPQHYVHKVMWDTHLKCETTTRCCHNNVTMSLHYFLIGIMNLLL